MGTLAGCSKKTQKYKTRLYMFFFTFYSKLQAGCIVVHAPTHAFSRNSYFYLKLAFFFGFLGQKTYLILLYIIHMFFHFELTSWFKSRFKVLRNFFIITVPLPCCSFFCISYFTILSLYHTVHYSEIKKQLFRNHRKYYRK